MKNIGKIALENITIHIRHKNGWKRGKLKQRSVSKKKEKNS
jgi:hypothetical protein